MKKSYALVGLTSILLTAGAAIAQNTTEDTTTNTPATPSTDTGTTTPTTTTPNNSNENKPIYAPQTKSPSALRTENLPQTADAQAWHTNITPGEFHNYLKALSGAWNCEVSFTVPGAPEQKSAGTMVSTMNLGGRYLVTAFHGEAAGQPFQGTGTWGYNNVSKRYESTWVDNMSTGITFETGSFDTGTKTFTMTGNFDDAETGTKKTQRTVYTIENNDRYTINFFETNNNASETKVMTFVCTRRTTDGKPNVRANFTTENKNADASTTDTTK